MLRGFTEILESAPFSCCRPPLLQFLPSLKVFDWEVKENPYTNVPYKASDPPHQIILLRLFFPLPSSDNLRSSDDASIKEVYFKDTASLD